MLKKMRWRFVEAAMCAFAVVVLALLIAVNLWNYHIVTKQLDLTLSNISKQSQEDPPPMPPDNFMMPPHSPETKFMMRFFIVRLDNDNQIINVNNDNIASVSKEQAENFAGDIIESDKKTGFYQFYRFTAFTKNNETDIIFLNAEKEIGSIKTLLIVSGIVSLISLGAVLILLIIFSKRAVWPYIKNIETQKRFITDAGHELKTPLTSISTSADILAMEQADNEWVTNIQTQSVRMSKLITNLVALSRLDEERPLLEKTNFSLSQALWEISEPFSARASAENKKYTQLIDDNVNFYGDENAIQQMISVLLDNAVRYCDKEGNIKVQLSHKGKKAEITVFNDCSSVKDIEISRIFDRFYRPDNSRSSHSGGNGIGLSIAKATAEAHGGKITAKVQQDKGILFMIIL